jgi:hypothetical protein
MSLQEFQKTPWQKSHGLYKKSALSISPAPEYASSEVLLSSLCRTIGFDGVNERGIPQAGKELDKKIQKLREKRSPAVDGASASAETWNTMLRGVLESPKLRNQSSKRFLQVTPIVAGMALFSGSARLTPNSWPAGSLIRRMVSLGSPDRHAGEALWNDLFTALSVDQGDDIFARWIEDETHAWLPGQTWGLVPLPEDEPRMDADDFANVRFLPARQFAKDLRAIIRAKEAMTRRQWTSLLEAILRLAAAAHVAWLCDVQARMWQCLSEALTSKGPLGGEQAREAIFPANPQYMNYGGKALPGLKDGISGYLGARLGINSVLWSLQEASVPFDGNLSSSNDVAMLCQHVRDNHAVLSANRTMHAFLDLRESESRAMNCKKGIGANMLEFARHVLGQRDPAEPLLRGYDQGYVLKKKGNGTSSPWVVSLGPVAVLALVHCSLAGMSGPRSIHRLGQHLTSYGIGIDRHEIAASDLGHQLRMLGLILDSPDAESGMLLLPPFTLTQPRQGI